MGNTRKTTTIQDVARHANVSSATVSRVLSSPERVSEGGARTGSGGRAGDRLLDQPGGPFAAPARRPDDPHRGAQYRQPVLLDGARCGDPHGVGARLFRARRVADRRGPQPLADRLPAAATAPTACWCSTARSTPVRCTRSCPRAASLPLIAAYDEWPDPRVNSVLTDNRAAAHRAVQHLLDYGHREIGHIAGPSRNASPNERLVGFHEAVQAAGLAIDPEWVIPGRLQHACRHHGSRADRGAQAPSDGGVLRQ
jgi:LacI family repressor for deo operon, udp, cdd, tsx, nupC, and nupG